MPAAHGAAGPRIRRSQIRRRSHSTEPKTPKLTSGKGHPRRARSCRVSHVRRRGCEGRGTQWAQHLAATLRSTFCILRGRQSIARQNTFNDLPIDCCSCRAVGGDQGELIKSEDAAAGAPRRQAEDEEQAEVHVVLLHSAAWIRQVAPRRCHRCRHRLLISAGSCSAPQPTMMPPHPTAGSVHCPTPRFPHSSTTFT